jgi:hypothetical protein
MKKLILTVAIFTSFNLFSQTSSVTPPDTLKNSNTEMILVKRAPTTGMDEIETGIIKYMETLTYEEKLDVLKSFCVGGVVYLKDGTVIK